MRKLWVLVVLMMACSCVTAKVMNRVSLGMSKKQVIHALGRPDSVSARGDAQVLNYRFPESDWDLWTSTERFYFVRMVDGSVESYGRQGELDSTQD